MDLQAKTAPYPPALTHVIIKENAKMASVNVSQAIEAMTAMKSSVPMLATVEVTVSTENAGSFHIYI